MISYIQLIDKVKSFCDRHLNIQRFECDFLEQMGNYSTMNSSYPFVYMVPINKSFNGSTQIMSVDIYVYDIIQKDRTNINTAYSDCDLIATDLYNFFKDSDDYSIDILNQPFITPINNSLMDYLTGVVMRVDFEIDMYCYQDIPFKDITPPVVETYNIITELQEPLITEAGDNLVWTL